MPMIERADAESVTSVEAFLSSQTGELVDLGSVYLATGRLGWILASVARASAITFGSTICLSTRKRPQVTLEVQAVLERFDGLFVHECVHVWQYRRCGWESFLRQYLKSYFSGIVTGRSIRRRARLAAYRSIPFEEEAFRLERAWVERAKVSTRGSREQT